MKTTAMRKILNPANILTLSRFALAPVAFWLVLTIDNTGTKSLAIFAILIAAILTDLFDGMVARAYKVVTNFGKIMDPVADSTFFMTLLFAYNDCPRFQLPLWIPVVVLWREVAMHVLRRYAALRGLVVAAKVSGKAKMVIQSLLMTGFTALVAASDMNYYKLTDAKIGEILLYFGIAIAAVNLISMIEYLRDIPMIKQDPAETQQQ